MLRNLTDWTFPLSLVIFFLIKRIKTLFCGFFSGVSLFSIVYSFLFSLPGPLQAICFQSLCWLRAPCGHSARVVALSTQIMICKTILGPVTPAIWAALQLNSKKTISSLMVNDHKQPGPRRRIMEEMRWRQPMCWHRESRHFHGIEWWAMYPRSRGNAPTCSSSHSIRIRGWKVVGFQNASHHLLSYSCNSESTLAREEETSISAKVLGLERGIIMCRLRGNVQQRQTKTWWKQVQ